MDLKKTKTRDTKMGTRFWPHLFFKISQYTVQRVNFVLGYQKLKSLKLSEVIMWPFCGDVKW